MSFCVSPCSFKSSLSAHNRLRFSWRCQHKFTPKFSSVIPNYTASHPRSFIRQDLIFVCFRNTCARARAQAHTQSLQSAVSKQKGLLVLVLSQLPEVQPASDTSHQLHVAAPISSVADRDVSPLNPSHPSPTDTRTAGETSAFCIQLQDVIAPSEVTS